MRSPSRETASWPLIVEIAPPQPAATPSFRRIRTASRGLEWLFTGLLAAFVALTAVGFGLLFFYHGQMIAFGPKGGLLTTGPVPPDYLALGDWRIDQRLAYAPVWAIRSRRSSGSSGACARSSGSTARPRCSARARRG